MNEKEEVTLEEQEETLVDTENQNLNQEIEDVFVRESDEKTEEADVFPVIGKDRYIEGIGRRKTAICRVRIYDDPKKRNDEFNIIINNRAYKEYFLNNPELIKIVESPLRKLRTKNYRVTVKAKGGGLRGQAEAIRLGLSRALVKLNPEWKPKLKKAGFLTRDPREVERKKYGLKKARRAPQWHKR